MSNNRIRIVLRRKISGFSKFMDSKFSVNLMMGFISKQTYEPQQKDGIWEIKFEIEQTVDSHHRDLLDVKVSSTDKKSIWDLYEEIIKKTNKPPVEDSIFSTDDEDYDHIVPVIYQPRIDAWKNFLREIHVSPMSENKYEITLIFQDEQLRKHFLFDFFYRIFRLFKHKRIVDVESFYFHRGEKQSFTFPGIFSGNSSLFDDNIHFDNPIKGRVEKRPVKYFFKNKKHPIVFVNTSNHALSPEDNNHDMWKWEYIPWSKDIPIKLGTQTRKEVEKNQNIILRKKLQENH